MNRAPTVFLIMIFLLASAASAQIPTPSVYTHTAVTDGLWHVASTWQNGIVPGDSATVLIPGNTRVIVITQETARLAYVHVQGEMRMSISWDTRLLLETLFVDDDGFFMIGDSVNTVHPDKTAEIVFISDGNPIDISWDPTEASRGFITANNSSKVRIYGHPKTHMAEMDLSAAAGQTAINLNLPVPVDWQIGDEIVFAGTNFQRGTPSRDERRTITNIIGQVIYLDQPLAYDHSRVSTDMNLHVANLTRNVVFRSESSSIPLRGHVMLRHSDVDIRHATFIDLGRTNKAIPLDEVIVDLDYGTVTPNPNIQNRRGRYSLHFHKNGIQPGQEPPSKVYGSVVIGTPGWAFVNHSSHVDFRENVAYDFVGSGFVTEFGDELGNFFDNVAIRGTGNGEYRPHRQVFANDERPQPLSDFAFGGDGFWFQGPAVRARDNVANGCNGAGMIWFTTGAVDIADNHYVGFPRAALSGAYAGYPDLANLEARTWSYDPDALVISDLPILECTGFDGYANLVGFHLRFNNSNNIAFYNEREFDYDLEIVPLPGQGRSYADRIRQSVSGLNLWNNELGFRVRYNEKTDWTDITNVNRLRHHGRLAKIGAELVFQTKSNTFDNLLISGYAIAGLIEAMSAGDIVNNRSEITLTGTTYQSYANPDTRITGSGIPPCDEATNVSASGVSASSVTINWDPDANADRFLVRYKPTAAAKWVFRQVVGTAASVTLINLQAATDYQFQVIVGCPDNVSLWSWTDAFTTLSNP